MPYFYYYYYYCRCQTQKWQLLVKLTLLLLLPRGCALIITGAHVSLGTWQAVSPPNPHLMPPQTARPLGQAPKQHVSEAKRNAEALFENKTITEIREVGSVHSVWWAPLPSS